jgi:YHS domain-containing protein
MILFHVTTFRKKLFTPTICLVAYSLLLSACQEKQTQTDSAISESVTSPATAPPPPIVASSISYAVGDRVPNNQVCMVNNVYMGKDQFVVPFEGKTYYGCCNMCTERLPKDATVRSAKDPLTGAEVDKANAFIVLTDANGTVAYFQNEANYKKFMASSTF